MHGFGYEVELDASKRSTGFHAREEWAIALKEPELNAGTEVREIDRFAERSWFDRTVATQKNLTMAQPNDFPEKAQQRTRSREC